MILLREQKIRLPRRGEIGHAVSRVEKDRPLVIRKAGVLPDLDGLVVAEPAAPGQFLAIQIRGTPHTSRGEGTGSASRSAR